MPPKPQRIPKNRSGLRNDASNPPDSPTKSGHLKKEDHLLIINWLMIKTNYDAVFGTENSTKIGRPPKSKVNGYQLMAANLKNKTKGRMDLSPKQMMERFKNYRSKYRKAHMLSSSTGFGISQADQERGIRSVFEKLDSICPYYDKMDELFGQHANVTPTYCEDSQQPLAAVCSSEDEEQTYNPPVHNPSILVHGSNHTDSIPLLCDSEDVSQHNFWYDSFCSFNLIAILYLF